jgi:hypothetical protein
LDRVSNIVVQGQLQQQGALRNKIKLKKLIDKYIYIILFFLFFIFPLTFDTKINNI